MPTSPGLVMQSYGSMSLTDFMKPEIAPNAEATLRHVLDSGVTVINTAGVAQYRIAAPLVSLAWSPQPAGTCVMRLLLRLPWVSCRILWTWDQ